MFFQTWAENAAVQNCVLPAFLKHTGPERESKKVNKGFNGQKFMPLLLKEEPFGLWRHRDPQGPSAIKLTRPNTYVFFLLSRQSKNFFFYCASFKRAMLRPTRWNEYVF